MNPEKGSVLVVDDIPENVQVLGDLLEQVGHEVYVAQNGPRAIEIAQNTQLDLILLDIMMPGMDGYTVCSKLKQNPSTSKIPVLFLTALSGEDDEAKGLGLGAVDYITKPFKVELVQARVEAHIELFRARNHLEDLVQKRSIQLAAAHQELKNLEEARYEVLQLLYEKLWQKPTGVFEIAKTAIQQISKDNPYQDHLKTQLLGIESEIERIISSNLLLQSGQQKVILSPIDISILLPTIVDSHKNEFLHKKINILLESLPDTPVSCSLDLLSMILDTLLLILVSVAEGGGQLKIQAEAKHNTMVVIFQLGPVALKENVAASMFSLQVAGLYETRAAALQKALNVALRISQNLGITMKAKMEGEQFLELEVNLPLHSRIHGVRISL